MSVRRGGPTLKPEESSHRAAKIAADMCAMNLQYMVTLSQFLSKGELLHMQLHLLYGLIDTIGATGQLDAEKVCDMCKRYFMTLRNERIEASNASD